MPFLRQAAARSAAPRSDPWPPFGCFSSRPLIIVTNSNCTAVATYAGASAGLAMRRRSSGVAELVRNITGTIDVAERDQVLMAAINVYATHHKEHPASLVDQLSNSHRSVHPSLLCCTPCAAVALDVANECGHVVRRTLGAPIHELGRNWILLYIPIVMHDSQPDRLLVCL